MSQMSLSPADIAGMTTVRFSKDEISPLTCIRLSAADLEQLRHCAVGADRWPIPDPATEKAQLDGVRQRLAEWRALDVPDLDS